MVIPWCPKTPADHILGTHNGAFGYACSHGIACHTTISIIWHTKKFNLVKWGVELKMNWLNWSIPISWGFQFQFNSNSKSFNSIPIQFMLNLNWIDYQFQFNSWIDPSPVCFTYLCFATTSTAENSTMQGRLKPLHKRLSRVNVSSHRHMT